MFHRPFGRTLEMLLLSLVVRLGLWFGPLWKISPSLVVRW